MGFNWAFKVLMKVLLYEHCVQLLRFINRFIILLFATLWMYLNTDAVNCVQFADLLSFNQGLIVTFRICTELKFIHHISYFLPQMEYDKKCRLVLHNLLEQRAF
jgi:hypothetical protein